MGKWCCSHRSIFSHKSMPPPRDSATHWPIRGRVHGFHLPLKNFFLLALFRSCHRSEITQPAAKKDLSLSRSLLRIFQYGRSSLKIRGYFLLATQKNQPCGLPRELPATVNTFYPLENQHTTCGTKKNLFSLWFEFTSAIRINPSLLCFKEVSLFILYYKLIYDMETNHKH